MTHNDLLLIPAKLEKKVRLFHLSDLLGRGAAMRSSLPEHPCRAARGRGGHERCGEGALSAARQGRVQEMLARPAEMAWRRETGGDHVPGWVDGGGNED